MPLDSATIERLMAVKNKPKAGTFAPSVGPLRHIEGQRRCTNRGCLTTAYYAVQGAPKCTVHALEELNEMLISAGFKGVATNGSSRPTPRPSGRVVSSTTIAKLDAGWALDKFECIHGIKLDQHCKVCGV